MLKRYLWVLAVWVLAVIVLACLVFSPQAQAATPTWQTIITGVDASGNEITSQVFGYTKDTSFGQIIVECDPNTGQETGKAYLNAIVGQKNIVVGTQKQRYIDWQNPRVFNRFDPEILAPNIPGAVQWDFEYHWAYPNDPWHYKVLYPLWPGSPTDIAIIPPQNLSPDDRMLVVVKATNPNPYPVRATVWGTVTTQPLSTSWAGLAYYAAGAVNQNLGIAGSATIDFAANETWYVRIPSSGVKKFYANYINQNQGYSAYSAAIAKVYGYQILAPEYPEELKVNGVTTIDCPPNALKYGNYTGGEVYGGSNPPPYPNPPAVPFDLSVKRWEPGWTRSYSTANLYRITGSANYWETEAYPPVGPTVVNDGEEVNLTRVSYRGDDIYVPKGNGNVIWGDLQPQLWNPSAKYHQWIPFFYADPLWLDQYTYVPQTKTTVIPGDGCNPPRTVVETLPYGTLEATPKHLYVIRRTLAQKPKVVESLVVNSCAVDKIVNIQGGCGTPQTTTIDHYEWNGSQFIKTGTYTRSTQSGDTYGMGIVNLNYSIIVQGVNPNSNLNFAIGQAVTQSNGCTTTVVGFNPQSIKVMLTNINQLQSSVSSLLGVTVSVPSNKVTITDTSFPAGTTKTVYCNTHALTFAVSNIDMVYEPPVYETDPYGCQRLVKPEKVPPIMQLIRQLNSLGRNEVILPKGVTVCFSDASPPEWDMFYCGPAAIYYASGWYKNYKQEWSDSATTHIIGLVPNSSLAISYYSTSNAHHGVINNASRMNYGVATFPIYFGSSLPNFTYYRLYDSSGNLIPEAQQF